MSAAGINSLVRTIGVMVSAMPPLVPPQGSSSYSQREVNSLVGEANKRIRKLKTANEKLRESRTESEQNLVDEILEKDEIIEAMQLHIAELKAELQAAKGERNAPGIGGRNDHKPFPMR